MAHRLVQHDAGPAGTQHDHHLAGRRRHRAQIDERLAQGLVDLAAPLGGVEIAVIFDAPAGARGAALHAVAVGDDDADIEADERPDVGGIVAAGAQDAHGLPLPAERHRDLAHARILAARIGVDLGEQLGLGREIEATQGIDVGIELPVRAGRRQGKRAADAGLHRAHGGGGAADRVLAQVRGMRIAAQFARQRAQPEALALVERRALDAAVVEHHHLRLAPFEEQLAVVHPGKRVADDALELAPVHAGADEEQIVGAGEIGHEDSFGTGALLPRSMAARQWRYRRIW